MVVVTGSSLRVCKARKRESAGERGGDKGEFECSHIIPLGCWAIKTGALVRALILLK